MNSCWLWMSGSLFISVLNVFQLYIVVTKMKLLDTHFDVPVQSFFLVDRREVFLI